MKILKYSAPAACLLLFHLSVATAQVDPGPRPGPAGAGGPIRGLSANDEKLFWASWERFKKVYSVSGKLEAGVGLGPGFNGNSCAQCHAQPAAGGSSPSPLSPQVRQVILDSHQHLTLAPTSNPLVALASLDRQPGHDQKVPSFLSKDGPVRVPRFIRNADGTLDGSTHNLYTIAGRVDAPDCNEPQTDFESQIASHNVVYRVPTPTFGGGLIESISDTSLIQNHEATQAERKALGIGGRFNRSSNDGTISRFGWKAQNKSLMIFAAESYSVEMGVTSETFPDKRIQGPGCVLNALPEDRIRVEAPSNAFSTSSELASDVVNFASFMRLSAPPSPATHSPSELNGKALFRKIGCATCHSPSLTTGKSSFEGMSQVKIEPYSDFALHHMGSRLSDDISQGLAGADEFRTAPLWGLGQRIFFLHDGRTSDLLDAIEWHSDKVRKSGIGRRRDDQEMFSSEANIVIQNFDSLPSSEKQDLLNFLRSL